MEAYNDNTYVKCVFIFFQFREGQRKAEEFSVWRQQVRKNGTNAIEQISLLFKPFFFYSKCY